MTAHRTTPSPAPPTTATTGTAPPGHLLRTVLRADAAVTGLNGAAYLLAAPVLADVLGLPAAPLRGVGVFLLAFAGAVWAVGSRAAIRPGAVVAVVAANLLWVGASVAIAVAGWGTPTPTGTVWIALQAAVVAAFAVLQEAGLRARTRS